MGYSGWRFTCDRCTLERCAGALAIKAHDLEHELDGADTVSDVIESCQRHAYLMGASMCLRAIVEDGDGIEPTEFVGQVESRYEPAQKAGDAS